MNLREVRQKAGLSMEEAAKRIGVSAVTIHQWETGKNGPRLTKVPKIALVYDISASEAMLACQESAKEGGKYGKK